MTHRDRPYGPSGGRNAVGDAGHRQGFPTHSDGPYGRPQRRLAKAFGQRRARLVMPRIATPHAPCRKPWQAVPMSHYQCSLVLNGEIKILAAFAENSGLIGAVAKIVNGQVVETVHQLFSKFQPQRPHHFVAEFGAGRVLDQLVVGFHFADDADNVADEDAAAFAGQAIPSARAADPDQNAVSDQMLKGLFQIPAGNFLAPGDIAALDRFGTGMIGNVENRLDREQHLFGQPQHDLAACSGGPETAFAARCLIEPIDLKPFSPADRRDDELGDALVEIWDRMELELRQAA